MSSEEQAAEDRLAKMPPKFAPCCSERAVPKSKSLNMTVSGRFWKFKLRFARQAQGFRHAATCVAGAGVREGCKSIGRRGGFEEGSQRCISCGRRRDFMFCGVDVSRSVGHSLCEVANFVCYISGMISRGSYKTAEVFRDKRNTFSNIYIYV